MSTLNMLKKGEREKFYSLYSLFFPMSCLKSVDVVSEAGLSLGGGEEISREPVFRLVVHKLRELPRHAGLVTDFDEENLVIFVTQDLV